MASRDLKPGQGVGARNAFGSKGWRASANPTALRRPSKPPLWNETGAYGIQYVSAFRRKAKSPRVDCSSFLVGTTAWRQKRDYENSGGKAIGEVKTGAYVHPGGVPLAPEEYPRRRRTGLSASSFALEGADQGNAWKCLAACVFGFYNSFTIPHAMRCEERTQPKRTRHGCCPQQVGRGGALHGYFSQHATHPPK